MNSMALYENKVLTLKDRPLCMLAMDVAALYGTESKKINQAVRRNPKKFPGEAFCFELTEPEIREVERSQIVTAPLKSNQYGVVAFTREGVNMLATILQTDTAIERSLQIVRLFSRVEEMAIRGEAAVPVGKRLVDEKVLEESQRKYIAVLEQTIELQRKLIEVPAVALPKPLRGSKISKQEQAEISRLQALGMSCSGIARKIGRSYRGVYRFMK